MAQVKERGGGGSSLISRAIKTENPLPRSLFAPNSNGNACYAGYCCCYLKSLELGFFMATRGATMMIVKIDSPTFRLITFIIRGNSRKMKVSQRPLEELRKRPGLG